MLAAALATLLHPVLQLLQLEGSAYSAHTTNELVSVLIYGLASVRKHKLHDLFKQLPTSCCLPMPFQHFFFLYRVKTMGERVLAA